MKTAEEYLKHLIEENQYENVEVHAGLQLVIDAMESYAKKQAIEFEEYCLQYPDWEKETEEIYNEWITNK